MSDVYCIVPTHNKENMINDVLTGIRNSMSGDVRIVCIVDGCTDATKDKVLEFQKMHKSTIILEQDNVHEIICLNTGLKFIEEEFNPKDDDLIFMVQDDVILKEENIDKKFNNLFSVHKNLGYVSMRIGLSIQAQNDSVFEYGFMESEFGHWNQLGWTMHKSIPYNHFAESEIAVRSPTCVLWKRFKDHGFFDSSMAPCGFDCHEFSIRMNEAGYSNGVYTMRYESKVDWGTMRQEKSSKYKGQDITDIYNRNKQYLVNKYRNYFSKK